MTLLGLRRIGYRLGEEKVWYRDLPGVVEEIAELGMPDDEELWGWGYCRRSPHDYETHIGRGFEEVVADLAAQPTAIDSLVICGPFQNPTERFVSALLSQVLPELPRPLEDRHVIEGLECVNVLQGIVTAGELIDAGRESILIVAAEKVEKEHGRFRRYSLFSDFCLALLVTRSVEGCPFQIHHAHVRADDEPRKNTSGILVRELDGLCVDEALTAQGVPIDAIAKLFYLNLYPPIAEMKGKSMGFREEQLYTAMTGELAHCYGADPFINLLSYSNENAAGDGEQHLLCTSGRSSAGVAVVRRPGGGGC